MGDLECVSQAIVATMSPYPGIFAFDFGRYLVAATLVAAAIFILSEPARGRRTVRIRTPEIGQRRREFAYSTLAAGIFALAGLGVYHGAQRGFFRIYEDIAEFGWTYWGISLILMVLTHDAYFYWTHRLMHRGSVFRWTHATHHHSMAPTVWAAYAFAPGEALVQAAFVPLFLLVIPMHASALFIWIAHQILRNTLGHAGVELMPKQWLATWWGRWLTTTLHHDLHHAHGKGNYGLYFTWWDKWGGTERGDYRPRLSALVETMESKPTKTASQEK